MRTTFTIDDQLLAELKELARLEGVSFKDMVNRALARGLEALRSPRRGRKGYRVTTYSMGEPRVPLDSALRIAEQLEDEETARKLERRK